MNHQIQGLVLVNNEWVSRPMDIFQIMARAQQDHVEMQEPACKPTSRVPEFGILSRTLFASPLFKFVLPANIRHKDSNDIVLVGEDSVQLKEICDYGRLRHVATKSDFKGRILAARVFGEPREVRSTKRVASPLPKKQSIYGARASVAGSQGHVLPSEIIVLTLTSRTLMFLWAQSTSTGAVTFSRKTVKLPAGSSRFDRLGTFLAVDPKHRAIAVAAHEGCFMLYKTKPIETWRNEDRAGFDTVPVEDERAMPIQGRIMHMEFLSSGDGQDDFHVVLLFIIVHQGKTKTTCFDWDCRYDLSTATARAERVLVDFEDQNPSLLIPLSRSPDFLLIFDTHISVYKDVLSGVPRRTVAPIPAHIVTPIRSGDSKRRPQWVQWDKAPRNPEFPKEVFYIAREDGRIMYAERGPAGSLDVNDAGDWPYRIDTAFACLSVDNSEFSQSYPDVLIAGGAGNDGLMCKLGAWPTEYSYGSQYPGTNQFDYIQSLPNWTPLADLCVTGLPGLRPPDERERFAIFVANGSTPNGEISELRYGLQALVDDFFSGMNGCTGLHVVDYGSQEVQEDGRRLRQHYVCFAITLPPETLLIRLVRTQPESRGGFSGPWEGGIWDKFQIPSGDEPIEDGFMRDEETISACSWSDHHAIQITRTEARLLRRPLLRQTDSISYKHPLLIAASRPGFHFIAVVFREENKTYLEIIPIEVDGTFSKTTQRDSRHQLPSDPTCIELLDIDGTPHAFVSTFHSRIYLLRIDKLGSPSLVLEESLGNSTIHGSLKLCESAVLLSSRQHQMLVCATRDGFLLSASLATKAQGSLPLSWNITKMGSTPARITPSSTDVSAAFVACGADFCCVRCSTSDAPALRIDSIWFADRINPGKLQSPVTAVCQLPFVKDLDVSGRNIGGFLFAVAGDQLLSSRLDFGIGWTNDNGSMLVQNDAKAVPRKLLTGARPTNFIHMQTKPRIVVSTIEAREGRAPPNGYRVLHSTLKLLKMCDDKPLDEPEANQEDAEEVADRLVVAQHSLKHAERVYSIVEWRFKNKEGKPYIFIIVGTGITVGPGKETGRRLIFSVGSRGTKLMLQKESTYEHPVYCVVMFNNRSTVSVIGKTLSFDQFDAETGRWFKRGTKDLPSPGIHVTVSSCFVHVSTLQHSHLCFSVANADGEGKVNFEQVFTDSRERWCAHHLVLAVDSANSGNEQDTIVLLTDRKSASVSALYHPPDRTYKNAADTVFEACLPQTVVRLQRGDVRPPWRRPGHLGAPSTNIKGILANDIIGACSDGTIYAFSILSKPALHMLRFIQNMIEAKQARDPTRQFTVVKPRGGNIFDVLMNGADGPQDGKIKASDVDPQYQKRGVAAPRNGHIDGDLLVGYFDQGGDVQTLVYEDMERDVESLFREFAGALREEWRDWESERVVEGVRRWLGEVLMPVL